MRSPLFLFILCITLIFISQNVLAATSAPVANTGQKKSYSNGDDGAVKPGVPWPFVGMAWPTVNRFINNSDGTITDKLTGLVWLKESRCLETLGGVTTKDGSTWLDALVWTKSLSNGKCGLSDKSVEGQWRLPNINELEILVDYSRAGTHMQNALSYEAQKIFGDTQSGFWSSTTSAFDNGYAWCILMKHGEARINTKKAYLAVWPIRNGLPGERVVK